MAVAYDSPKKNTVGMGLKNFFTRLGKKGIATVVGVLILLGGIGYLSWLYLDAKAETRRFTEDPQAAAAAGLAETVEKVGKLMVLPDDETPTLAAVSDVEQLREQPFFAKAVNGDKVLIYTKNRLAILYRPSTNKIVAVGTVNLNTSGK